MKKILSILARSSFITALAGMLLFATPYASALAPHFADARGDVCSGIGLVGNGGNCGDNGAAVGSAITAAINILTIIAGIVTVVMVIVAGLKFVTSGGDASKVASAKNSLIYALIGLLVVVLSQTLVHFVLTNAK